MEGMHECELVREANSCYHVMVYKVEDTWYHRIEEDEVEEEQTVVYCPYCGMPLK